MAAITKKKMQIKEGVGPVRSSDRLVRKKPDVPLARSLTPAPALALALALALAPSPSPGLTVEPTKDKHKYHTTDATNKNSNKETQPTQRTKQVLPIRLHTLVPQTWSL